MEEQKHTSSPSFSAARLVACISHPRVIACLLVLCMTLSCKMQLFL